MADDANPLVRALFQQEPIAVIRFLVEDTPRWLRHWDKRGMLPIHRIFEMHPLPSPKVVRYLIRQWPESVRMWTSTGSLPIHLACAYTSTQDAWNDSFAEVFAEVVSLLVEHFPGSILERDANDQLPLHLACMDIDTFCDNPPLREVIRLLVKAAPEASREKNAHGLSLLHGALPVAPVEEEQDNQLTGQEEPSCGPESPAESPTETANPWACNETTSKGRSIAPPPPPPPVSVTIRPPAARPFAQQRSAEAPWTGGKSTLPVSLTIRPTAARPFAQQRSSEAPTTGENPSPPVSLTIRPTAARPFTQQRSAEAPTTGGKSTPPVSLTIRPTAARPFAQQRSSEAPTTGGKSTPPVSLTIRPTAARPFTQQRSAETPTTGGKSTPPVSLTIRPPAARVLAQQRSAEAPSTGGRVSVVIRPPAAGRLAQQRSTEAALTGGTSTPLLPIAERKLSQNVPFNGSRNRFLSSSRLPSHRNDPENRLQIGIVLETAELSSKRRAPNGENP
jgi:hypothetical protein